MSEKIQDLREFPVICQVSDASKKQEKRIYAINFSDELQISKRETTIKDMEHYFDFAHGLGIKQYELFALSSFAYRFQMALPENNQ